MDGEVRRAKRPPATTAERHHVGAASSAVLGGSSPSAGGACSLLAPVPLILGLGLLCLWFFYLLYVFSKTNVFSMSIGIHPEASARVHGQLGLPDSTLVTVGFQFCLNSQALRTVGDRALAGRPPQGSLRGLCQRWGLTVAPALSRLPMKKVDVTMSHPGVGLVFP